MGSRHVKPLTRGLILLLLGTPFAAIGILAAFGAHELQQRGVLTQGSVVEKYTSRVTTKGKGHLHYKLRVSYAGPDGNEFEHVTEARDARHFESLEVGDVIDLVYDPQNPSRAAVPWQLAQPWRLAALMVAGLGLALMGLGCWILLRQRRTAAG